MKRCFLQRMVQCADANDAAQHAATPRLVRRALADASPGVAPAQRWQQLQQRINTHHVHEAMAQRCAPGVAAYYVYLFMRPRYSFAAPIM